MLELTLSMGIYCCEVPKSRPFASWHNIALSLILCGAANDLVRPPHHFFTLDAPYPCHTYSSASPSVCRLTAHPRAQRCAQIRIGRDIPWPRALSPSVRWPEPVVHVVAHHIRIEQIPAPTSIHIRIGFAALSGMRRS